MNNGLRHKTVGYTPAEQVARKRKATRPATQSVAWGLCPTLRSLPPSGIRCKKAADISPTASPFCRSKGRVALLHCPDYATAKVLTNFYEIIPFTQFVRHSPSILSINIISNACKSKSITEIAYFFSPVHRRWLPRNKIIICMK